ncbi:unnamed protein product [Blepharisma stoltei]|uniref:Muniscin C-terminal domain-containing protein n=1 Tax=Blepharisma stoltei TaxID=1481888 RepID=A0AAU9K3Q6_9CILI|nr:unnamed protein product [Blepharisma stoltei]
MGEIAGILMTSGGCIAVQSRHTVPITVAHSLCRELISSLAKNEEQEKNGQVIMKTFRGHYVISNDVVIMVFATITENPFVAEDCLAKIKEILLTLSKGNEIKPENLIKKITEINYALEDCLYSLNPYGRLGKCELFSISKPLQNCFSVLQSQNSNLIYNSKPWTDEDNILTSARAKAQNQLKHEEKLISLKFTFPIQSDIQPPQAMVHPFAYQFIEENAPILTPSNSKVIEPGPSSTDLSFLPSTPMQNQQKKTAQIPQIKPNLRITIMEKALVAFQDNKIRNMRVVGQLGLEVPDLAAAFQESSLRIKMTNINWDDKTKIAKRMCVEGIEEIDPYLYKVKLGNFEKSSAIIEYIVAPTTINIKNFPLYTAYNMSQTSEVEHLLQLKYQVNQNWKSSLEDINFTIALTDSQAVLIEANSRGELTTGNLEWKSSKLTTSQKGILEARINSRLVCGIDHIKISFKSRETLLSDIDAVYSQENEIESTPASKRLLVEVIISPNS